ncbi:MAG TPA: FAD-dependent oxidoreductase [Nitrospira sp.]|nr:FAD-dependent oxidoreductase [Nitrospira sp.]
MAPLAILVTAPSSQTVVIAGAGLAGLATACQLTQQGYQVTLLEYADWSDGFRTTASDPTLITLGCHHETNRMLQNLAQETGSCSDQTIPLEFRLPTGQTVPYQSVRLPGAFQWMMSFFSFQGLSWQDRWRLFSHVEQIWEQAETLPADLENRTADEWLTTTGQSAEARDRIWAPLAQWLTDNALTRLSAASFVHILSTVFLSDASGARLTYRSGTIDQRLLTPLKETLRRYPVRSISLAQPPHIRFGQDGVQDIRLHDGTIVQAGWYISALSCQHLLRLLPERFLTRYAYFAHLTELQILGEIAVQLTARTTNQLPRLLLLDGKPFHHLTSAPIGSHEVVFRLTGSETSLMGLGEEQIVKAAQAELYTIFPNMPQGDITSRQLARENHAALLLAPGAARLRPLQQSPIQNLLVGGAWTDTGWPPNVESALVSAHRCVDLVTGHTS